MATNAQNTVAGTANGGSVFDTQGNWFLEQIDKLTNVAVGTTNSVGAAGYSILDTIGGFKDRLKTLGLIKQDEQAPPQQSLSENLVNSAQGFFSDPARIQQALFYAAVGTAGLVGIWYAVKAVRK